MLVVILIQVAIAIALSVTVVVMLKRFAQVDDDIELILSNDSDIKSRLDAHYQDICRIEKAVDDVDPRKTSADQQAEEAVESTTKRASRVDYKERLKKYYKYRRQGMTAEQAAFAVKIKKQTAYNYERMYKEKYRLQ